MICVLCYCALQVFTITLTENSGRVLDQGEPLSVAPGMVFYLKVELLYVVHAMLILCVDRHSIVMLSTTP